MTRGAHRGASRTRPAAGPTPPRPDDPAGSPVSAAPAAGAIAAARGRSPLLSYALLAALVILCLAPFSGRAFNIDEPLFVWAAKQIVRHPLDPYGFRLNWNTTSLPMSEVTKNPPLASYYGALIGSLAGWSERTLHLAFLLPALAVVLGTYRLARRLCRAPVLAAAAALLTPGLLVSASMVTCDTMMLAFWVLAVALWVEGLEPERPGLLIAAALLVAASALSKYFGVALIPLLLVYSLARRGRAGRWAWYLAIPLVCLAGYQIWTRGLYGRGLLSDAAAYTGAVRLGPGGPTLPLILESVAFAGGSMLPALAFAPLLWRRRGILLGAILCGLAGLAVGMGWLPPGAAAFERHRALVGLQFALWSGGGVSVLALAATELRRRRDAETLLLALWVLGTFLFAGFLNWTVNARSVLPLIPAAAILLARRLEGGRAAGSMRRVALGVPLLLSGLVSLWVVLADAGLADSARRASSLVHARTSREPRPVWFQGHWGFQYYMESLGARPLDFEGTEVRPGDIMVVPENNTETPGVRPQLVGAEQIVELPVRSWLTTMSMPRGAGFHSTIWGPLPFAFGPAPAERYHILRLRSVRGTPERAGGARP